MLTTAQLHGIALSQRRYEERREERAARRFGAVCLVMLMGVLVWVGLLP